MKKLILFGQLSVAVLLASCLKTREKKPVAPNESNNNQGARLSAGPNQHLGVTCGFQYSAQLI